MTLCWLTRLWALPVGLGVMLVSLAGCTAEIPRSADLTSSRDLAQPLSGTIQLSGSSTIGPLAVEIAYRFEKIHSQVRVEVQTGGSSRGIADARSGVVDIGMSSRSLRRSEAEDLVVWPIAHDGVCFIVHADNPVPELSRRHLRDIFSGRVSNWSQVGGDDAEIVVINRAAGRSELELVTTWLAMEPKFIEADLIAGENQQGIKMVATNPHAITYMSIGAAAYESVGGTAVRRLPLEGVAASPDTVANGRYPLRRPLIFVTRAAPSRLAQSLIDFARSDAVDDLVREFSYVPTEH